MDVILGHFFVYIFFRFLVFTANTTIAMPGPPNSTQIAAACGEILFFTIIGYYTLKFILGKLDPTNKQKTEAKICVRISSINHLVQLLHFFIII